MTFTVIKEGVEVASATEDGIISIIEAGILRDGDIIKVTE